MGKELFGSIPVHKGLRMMCQKHSGGLKSYFKTSKSFFFFFIEAQLGGFRLFQLSCSRKVSNSLQAPIKPLILQYLNSTIAFEKYLLALGIFTAINKHFCSPLTASSYLFEMVLMQRLTPSHICMLTRIKIYFHLQGSSHISVPTFFKNRRLSLYDFIL